MTETFKQQMMSQSYDQYIGVIEGILFAAGDAVEISDIAAALSLSVGVIDQIADIMASEYEKVSRGIRLIRVGGSLQLSTKPILYPYISQILSLRQSGSLSRAALETLSIIAYRQPITRVEVEQIRGVSSASSIKNLLDRGMISEAGRKDAPGRPFFYKTTEAFLKAAHVEKLIDLPEFEAFMNASIEENVEEAMTGDDQQLDDEKTMALGSDYTSADEMKAQDDDQTISEEMITEADDQLTTQEALSSEVSDQLYNDVITEKSAQAESKKAIAGNAVETSVKGLKAFELISSTETAEADNLNDGEET